MTTVTRTNQPCRNRDARDTPLPPYSMRPPQVGQVGAPKPGIGLLQG